jgi:hypothetical protein
VAWWNEQRALVGLGPEGRPPEENRWYRCSPWLTFVLGLPELVHPRGDLPLYARRVGPTRWLPPPAEPPPSWVAELGRERRAVLASVSTAGPTDRALLEAVVAPSLPHDAVLPRMSAVVSRLLCGAPCGAFSTIPTTVSARKRSPPEQLNTPRPPSSRLDRGRRRGCCV